MWDWRCLLFGHEAELKLRSPEMYLKCLRCGRRSPGITIDGPTPTRTYAGDHARAQVVMQRGRVLDFQRLH